ncbi:hypothetical protein L6164_016185 [Bauhinia variegata]|uniref:Uncharacterized protein n=1 Tax=Bauhinia variegata TaxID=167791 RepID=A0ACB9NMR7_BAUVA|nr:hypothetical protein L6164_016185 [Bauhinia variegata]
MAVITTDSPISRRIVRAFLNFLDSVEPVPGVDLEGLEVSKECLTEIFKLDKYPVDDDARCDSLVNIFKSLEANKQSETTKSVIGVQANSVDASSSLSAQNAAHTKDHLGSSKSLDKDWTQGTQTFGVSKDELCGQFFAALEKNHFFRTRTDGSDDPVQLEKASQIFVEGIMELERSGCREFNLRNLAESLKSHGNKAMQAKKYTDAIELYDCAIALCDNNAVYHCNRAAAYTQIHKYNEAIQDCLRSIEIDQNYSKAYSRLGLAYYAQGNYRDAIDQGFKKALQLDPNNESVKENIRVAEQKLSEQQQRADNGQFPRWFQEFQNRTAQGSANHEAPPTFGSMPFNASDMASMFMNMATNASHGHGPQERQGEDRSNNSSETNEPEIRIGHNVSINLGEIPVPMPEELSGALRSVMEMLSGAAPQGQQQNHMNGGNSPN